MSPLKKHNKEENSGVLMKTEKKIELLNWYETSAEKAINIKTVPYMGIEPVKDLIEKVLKDGGRVL